jgi:nucleoside 2-deoxyribosyltransferase
MRLYIAAPLFAEAERAFNVVLARALEAAGHDVYLPQRDTPRIEGAERTRGTFQANLAALATAEAVLAVCDGSQVDDGTAWEIGYAYGRNMQVYGLRTDPRVGQQPDERINLMILESLSELSSTIEQALVRGTSVVGKGFTGIGRGAIRRAPSMSVFQVRH